MKRHKYKLKKHYVAWDLKREVLHNTITYFNKQEAGALSLPAKIFLRSNYLAVSRASAFCVVSGRVRFTFKLFCNSRHIFFERWARGFSAGFFMSSW